MYTCDTTVGRGDVAAPACGLPTCLKSRDEADAADRKCRGYRRVGRARGVQAVAIAEVPSTPGACRYFGPAKPLALSAENWSAKTLRNQHGGAVWSRLRWSTDSRRRGQRSTRLWSRRRCLGFGAWPPPGQVRIEAHGMGKGPYLPLVPRVFAGPAQWWRVKPDC